MTDIKVIAINYGEPRYGRSCKNCNYADKKIMSIECGLHCLPTVANACCGTWCGDKKIKIAEKQSELF